MSEKKVLGALLGAGVLAFLGLKARATPRVCYDITIDWGVRWVVPDIEVPLCKYDNKNHAVLLLDMGAITYVSPRIGIWKASRGYGGWKLESLLINLMKHTRKTNNPLFSKRTTFTIVCSANGCYVDGKKICSESRPNLNFPVDVRYKAKYITRIC